MIEYRVKEYLVYSTTWLMPGKYRCVDVRNYNLYLVDEVPKDTELFFTYTEAIEKARRNANGNNPN